MGGREFLKAIRAEIFLGNDRAGKQDPGEAQVDGLVHEAMSVGAMHAIAMGRVGRKAKKVARFVQEHEARHVGGSRPAGKFSDVLAINEDGTGIGSACGHRFARLKAPEAAVVEKKVSKCRIRLPGTFGIAAREVLGSQALRGGSGDGWIEADGHAARFLAMSLEKSLERLQVGWAGFGPGNSVDLDFEAGVHVGRSEEAVGLPVVPDGFGFR